MSTTRHDLAVVSVLFGATEIPEFLVKLCRSGARVVVVDNSGDLMLAPDPEISVLRPGRNLGYPAAINLGVTHLLEDRAAEFVLLANPDMTLSPVFVDALCAAACGPRPVISFPVLPGGATVGWQRRPTALGSAAAYAFRFHRATYGVRPVRYPSGALLLLNASALRLLRRNDRLLDPDLFFMDDVEIADRARTQNVAFSPVSADPTDVVHESNGTAWRAPGVPYFFRRAAKVRYWSARGQRTSAGILAGVVMAEALLIVATATMIRRSKLVSVRSAALLLLRSAGGWRRSFDDRVLGFGYHDATPSPG